MNTINGNFIERIIPNIKNATLNLLIGDQLATMNLADFQAAIAPSSKGLKMKDNLPLDATLNNVVDSSDVVTISPLQLSTEAVGVLRTVNLSAGATTPRLFNVAYTINNSGAQTGTLTGLFLNATETALNGITHNLMDLQVGGVSKFKVDRTGATTLGSGSICSDFSATLLRVGTIYFGAAYGSIQPTSQGVFRFLDAPETSFNRLQLGGTTSSFPAIKRNGAAIDFRLADDSGYANISFSKTINWCTGTSTVKWSTNLDVNRFSFGLTFYNSSGNAVVEFGQSGESVFNSSMLIGTAASTADASSMLEVRSTTKGFLMPRMTQAQILAIAAPAAGLQVFNTDLQAPCFYDGTAARWERCSHSVM